MGKSRSAAAIAIAVALAVVLAGDVALVVARAGDGPRTDPGASQALEAVLPELVAFVEEARGLRFLHPPDVELLADDRFEALLLDDDSGGGTDGDRAADDAAYLGLLRALGLVKGKPDLGEVASDAAADVVGFYDNATEVLYARGVEPTPYVMFVLVHELTHALDDQLFDLDRPDLGDDESSAFDALVEGSAVTVEQRWLDSRPPAEREEISSEDGGAEPAPGSGTGTGTYDDVFTALFDFPYAVGPQFVQALLDAGGRARLDAAFRDPPVTTEQVLHPERFLAGQGAAPVAEPPADGTVIDEGELGELGLILVLDAAGGHDTALRAAAGWGGDRYVAWSSGPRTCVRWAIAMDSTKDTAELVEALRPWLTANRTATVRGTDPVVLTNCA